MLLGNYNQWNASPGRAIGGPTDPTIWRKFGSKNNFYYGDAHVAYETDKSAFNNGYALHSAWHLSPKAGGLSTFNEINGEGELTISSLSMGKAVAANLAGVGAISPDPSLSMVVSLIAALAGVGSLSASMVGTIQMAAALVGTGSITAGLSLLANCVAALTGTGTVTSTLRGDAYLSADIFVNQSEATTQEIAAAVWNSVAASFNTSGTMGEKLNGAGSAGDPWTTDLSGYTTAGTAGKILKEKLSLNNFIALKGE